MPKQKLILIVLISISINFLTNSQPDKYKSEEEYIQDLNRLNDKITSFDIFTYDLIIPKGIQNAARISTLKQFESETIYLNQKQHAQFLYKNLGQDIIQMKVKQANISDIDVKKYVTAKQHYLQSQQNFTEIDGITSMCKIQDPEIIIQSLTYHQNLLIKTNGQFVQQRQMNSYIVYLDDKNLYHFLIQNEKKIIHYILNIKLQNYAQILLKYELNITNVLKMNQEIFQKVFLVDYKDKFLVFNGEEFYQIITNNDQLLLKYYGKINKDSKNSFKADNSSSNNVRDFYGSQIINVFKLKYGLLIQYSTSFTILTQGIKYENQTLFNYSISAKEVEKFTKGNIIIDIQIGEELSHNNGYKIYVLVQNIGLLEFQYGSYSSVNVYSISYGDEYLDLQVSNDIVEIVFSIQKSKMAVNYVAELFIDRKDNPRQPKIYLNRFYDHLQDVRKIQIRNNELILIGKSDVLLFGFPINSKTLIKESITQYPYHYSITELFDIVSLDRYSSPPLNSLLLIISKDSFSILNLTKSYQTIKCSGDRNIDLRIQILDPCQADKINNLCKYSGSIRIFTQQQASNQIKSVKKYLIILLIFGIIISLFIILRQILKNRKTMEKLRKIKEKISEKYEQFQNKHINKQAKGKKLREDEKYQQFEDEKQMKSGPFKIVENKPQQDNFQSK